LVLISLTALILRRVILENPTH